MFLRIALTFAAALILLPEIAIADNIRRPLLIEGKTTLYQRVLSRPGAVLVDKAGEDAGNENSELPPFSVFFVYGRSEVDGREWLEVSGTAEGGDTRFLPADDALGWKQTMTVSFANPSGRDRVLFFRSQDALRAILESEDMAAASKSIRRTMLKGVVPEDFPVISVEPATVVDFRKEFYLLPILDAKRTRTKARLPVRVLQVASATLEAGEEDKITDEESWEDIIAEVDQSDPEIEGFKTGVVFVVDSTISMDPYINRTRSAITRIFTAIEKAGLSGSVSFGLVAFRSNVNAVPGLEYVSRVYSDLDEGFDPDVLLSKISDVKAANVSSSRFSEDAFAGIVSALNDLNWQNIGGRFIVLITDAGALRGDDPLSSTRMYADQVRSLAKENGAAIFTLHLYTAAGTKYHERDAAQYMNLSQYPGLDSLYFGVEAGDVEKFGKVLNLLTTTLVGQVFDASKQKVADPAGMPSLDESPNPLEALDGGLSESAENEQLKALKTKSVVVGRTMQLTYLGSQKGAKAPRLIEAWIADRDFSRPTTSTLDVRVLLTKNQLSDLEESLGAVIEAGEQAIITSGSFLDQVRSAAAALSRNPAALGKSSTKQLGELGLLGEYLDGLPYQSKIMSIDEELWSSWSVGEQEALISELKAKIELYRRFHDDVNSWVLLSEEANSGEAVYPVPLESLP